MIGETRTHYKIRDKIDGFDRERVIVRPLGFIACALFFFSLPLNATTFFVTTTADKGDGSLRKAITEANALPNVPPNQPDSILFSILIDDDGTPDGVFTISPQNALPRVTDAVIIDGSTEPSFAGIPVIELDGSTTTNGPLSKGRTAGLHLSAHMGSTVKGLIINNFTHAGILIEGGGGHVVVGNFLGTDAGGTVVEGNDRGVMIANSSNNRVGPTPDAPDESEINISSGNGVGVELIGFTTLDGDGTPAPCHNNLVVGNYLGTDLSGNLNLGNNSRGVHLISAKFSQVVNNVVAYNGNQGILLRGDSDDNLIDGNHVSDSDREGIEIFGSFDQDPSLSSDRNTVSNNTVVRSSRRERLAGIWLQGGANHNVIKDNSISDGNSFGVVLVSGVNNNTIEGNSIHHNGRGGVLVNSDNHSNPSVPSTTVNNRIVSNSIYSNSGPGNSGLGIDLSERRSLDFLGVTPNDVLDLDSGANDFQNFPVLAENTVWNPAQVVVEGDLDSAPNTAFTIQVFANAEPDPSGHGEGQQFIGTTTVTTDAGGHAHFTLPTEISNLVGDGQTSYLTSTATDPNGNTSEFGPAMEVVLVEG